MLSPVRSFPNASMKLPERAYAERLIRQKLKNSRFIIKELVKEVKMNYWIVFVLVILVLILGIIYYYYYYRKLSGSSKEGKIMENKPSENGFEERIKKIEKKLIG